MVSLPYPLPAVDDAFELHVVDMAPVLADGATLDVSAGGEDRGVINLNAPRLGGKQGELPVALAVRPYFRFAAALLDRGLDVEVVDPDLRSLWRALQHAVDRPGRIDLHWSTGEALPDVAGRTILECQGPITSRLVPRPSSLQSAAHKNLTLAVRQRNMKKARIQEMTTTEDPELEKARKIKANEDLAKQERRKGSRRRSVLR